MAKGYANATVADIVARAGVARDVFYEHFTDKEHAFLEAQQHPVQHIVDTCASAYFSATRLARARVERARRAAQADRLRARRSRTCAWSSATPPDPSRFAAARK